MGDSLQAQCIAIKLYLAISLWLSGRGDPSAQPIFFMRIEAFQASSAVHIPREPRLLNEIGEQPRLARRERL